MYIARRYGTTVIVRKSFIFKCIKLLVITHLSWPLKCKYRELSYPFNKIDRKKINKTRKRLCFNSKVTGFIENCLSTSLPLVTQKVNCELAVVVLLLLTSTLLEHVMLFVLDHRVIMTASLA